MKNLFKFVIQQYLRLLTKIVLWRHRPMIVAISGTTNKTFIKELILQEIGSNLDVRGNPRSFNTEIGLPLAVLFLPSGYSSIFKWADILFEGTFISIFSRKFPKILVLEMGVDRKGDMSYLLSMVKPDMAVITNVDRSFPDNNTTVDDMVEEMRQLVVNVKKKGTVFLNGDDERVKLLSENCKQKRVLTWGFCEDCDAKINEIQKTDFGQSFVLERDGKKEKIEIDKFGVHNVSARAAAKIVVGEILKMKNEKRI